MTSRAEKTVAIVGAGRTGGALGFLLARAGYRITTVVTRSLESAAAAARFIGAGEPSTDAGRAAAGAAIVLITTPDQAVQPVCEEIARRGGFRRGSIAVHAAGAHTLDLLDAALQAGALRAVIHPLQSVPTRAQGVRCIPGSYFRIEADEPALTPAREVVRALGGTELALPKWSADRQSAALYHAGAVAVSNYLVALIAYGLQCFETLGAERQQALAALLPLVRGTLANIESLGIPAALTGPVARGDEETVRRHLEAMRERAPELLDLYRCLARQTVALARARGDLAPQAAADLLEIVRE